MLHSIFQIILGRFVWKYLPHLLGFNNTNKLDHYVIVGMSLIGIFIMIIGICHLVESLLVW